MIYIYKSLDGTSWKQNYRNNNRKPLSFKSFACIKQTKLHIYREDHLKSLILYVCGTGQKNLKETNF